MLTKRIKSSGTLWLLLTCVYQTAYAQGLERKVDCSSSAESVVQVLRVDDVENDFITIHIESWSDYFELENIRINGIKAAKATIHFPKSHCLIREKSDQHPYLLACGSGIGSGPIRLFDVELTKLDGSKHRTTLNLNVLFQVENKVTNSVFATRNTNLISGSFRLHSTGDHAGVAFLLNRECRQ